MTAARRIILTFAVIVVFAAFLSAGDKLSKKADQKYGDVVLEGYLVSLCAWQAVPRLKDVKSSLYGTTNCFLDVWLSKEKPQGGAMPDICNKSPITSKCLLEGVVSFNPWSDELNKLPKVILRGRYEKMKVCTLLRKCLEPECSDCKEQDVFVPCAAIKE
jgi:hypothetical protein